MDFMLIIHFFVLSFLLLNSVSLFVLPFQASQDKKSVDVGANLFVGNLDPVSSSTLSPDLCI